jgi:hypothetical protein
MKQLMLKAVVGIGIVLVALVIYGIVSDVASHQR